MRCSLVLIILIGLYSCDDKSKQLTPEERYTVDTLYQNDLVKQRTLIDTLCATRRDSIFGSASDSLYKQNISEIEELFMIKK